MNHVLAGTAQGLVVVLVLALWLGEVVSVPFTGTALALALALLCAALGASLLRGGRPQPAWQAAVMWRTSWTSRETIVLPAFIAAVALWWLALQVGMRPRAALLPVLLLALGLWWCTAMSRVARRGVGEGASPQMPAGLVLTGLSLGAALTCALAALTGEERLLIAVGRWTVGLTALVGVVQLAGLVRREQRMTRSTLQSSTGNDTRAVAKPAMPRWLMGAALGIGHVLPPALMVFAIVRPTVWPWLTAPLPLVVALLAGHQPVGRRPVQNAHNPETR